MNGTLVRFLVGIAVVLSAWTVGRLQGQAETQLADFHIRILAPEGKTYLFCERGCSWKTTSFGCSNSANDQCGSGYNQNGFVRSTTPWPDTGGAGS